MKKILFVLGGNDGEMEVIKNLLFSAGISFVQPEKSWGQKEFGPSDLGLNIAQKDVGSHYPGMGNPPKMVDTIEGEPFVVFVECGMKNWPEHADKPTVIDHHGERNGEAASLTQVVACLKHLSARLVLDAKNSNLASYYGITSADFAENYVIKIQTAINFSSATQRWMELVAANDARYISGMLAIGATQEEINQVRSFDRRAQGITPAQEVEADRAIAEKEVIGRLTVIHMYHSKTATVADRMFGQHDQLLILSGDGEANFYGDGALCAELKQKFEGWNGGSGLGKSGENAYWGGCPKHEELLDFIQQRLG